MTNSFGNITNSGQGQEASFGKDLKQKRSPSGELGLWII
jgi:hypothetical protein